MTRNLLLATIFLAASVLVLGYSWVAESANLLDRNARITGQQLPISASAISNAASAFMRRSSRMASTSSRVDAMARPLSAISVAK